MGLEWKYLNELNSTLTFFIGLTPDLDMSLERGFTLLKIYPHMSRFAFLLISFLVKRFVPAFILTNILLSYLQWLVSILTTIDKVIRDQLEEVFTTGKSNSCKRAFVVKFRFKVVKPKIQKSLSCLNFFLKIKTAIVLTVVSGILFAPFPTVE